MSAQKKQQSISKFFSAKAAAPPSKSSPPSTAPPISLPNQSSHTEPSDGGPDETTLFVPSEAEESDNVRSRRRSSKRVVEDEDFEDERPRKLARSSREPLSERPLQGGASPSKTELNQKRGPKITDRTSRFLYANRGEDVTDSSSDRDPLKDKLHQRFVKKLGRPDSFAELRRRNHIIDETAQNEQDDAEDEDAEDQPPASTRGKKQPATKKGGNKLTPMEKQIVDLKRKHPEAMLVVEVGYKFRFFGEDARAAAKELGIVCIPGKFRFDEHPSEVHLDRFASASFPTHRLHVHVKRLVAAGHKVGVVRQLETAALKAVGDNRNTPFVRELTNLYTKGTYIDKGEDLDSSISAPAGGAPATGHLLCITETNAKGWGTDEKVRVGIVAVQPATGDIIYDDFEDGFMRSEIETRLLHIAPCEFLIVGDLSSTTDKLVKHLSGSRLNVFGDKARVERVDRSKTEAANAYASISKFYNEKVKESETESSSRILDKTHNLSENVAICLAAMIHHLTEYGLQHVFDLTKNFQGFSARSHMLLNGTTLSSLDIYRNQTDHSERGSLFWILDETRTRFGQRLLRKWVGRPLLDKEKLTERINAVEELRSSERTMTADKIKELLSKTRTDLEKSLIRIYYKKCKRSELLAVLQTLQHVSGAFAHVKTPDQAGFNSQLLNDAISRLPVIVQDVVDYLDRINGSAATDNDKTEFFREEYETEDIKNHKAAIAAIEADLEEHRSEAAQKLKKKKVDYVTVAGIDFLIEVDNAQIKSVPASWMKISGTKKLSRFHTPDVVRLIRERDQHKESLIAACDAAFTDLLEEISGKYQSFRDCIQSLATLDCLLSLSEVAGKPGYCKPTFTEDIRVNITGGRHPMVEQILVDSYVPNNVILANDATRGLLVTGPNMGGKSSYVRQVALISIMGQIGSYVPAESAELGMLDAVFTRMGAFDNMMAGESTFMVELSETADILKQASPRSLIILDELGRGTSTHDGVAIAHSVLDYIIREKESLLLFITHYQSLSSVAPTFKNFELRNVHVKFAEKENDGQDITFLYEIGEGVAHRSYGLNVAKLANVPDTVLQTAGIKSKEMEWDIRRARLNSAIKCMTSALGDAGDMDGLVESIEAM